LEFANANGSRFGGAETDENDIAAPQRLARDHHVSSEMARRSKRGLSKRRISSTAAPASEGSAQSRR
jgi:hypothetical protein